MTALAGVLIGGVATVATTYVAAGQQRKLQIAESDRVREDELRKLRTSTYLAYMKAFNDLENGVDALGTCHDNAGTEDQAVVAVKCQRESTTIVLARKAEGVESDKIYVYGSKTAISASRELDRTINVWLGDVLDYGPGDDSYHAYFLARESFLDAVCSDVNTSNDRLC